MPTPSDPFYTVTPIHFPFDTDTVNKALSSNTSSVTGSVAIDTSVKKFGSGSAAFPATGARIVMSNAGGGDFSDGATVEGWLHFDNLSATKVVYQTYTNTGSMNGHHVQVSPQGGFGLYAREYYVINPASNQGTITTGVWTHFALVFIGLSVNLYIGGVFVSTGTFSMVRGVQASDKFFIGGDVYNNSLGGRLDDFRFTKGVARYTENFTPPGAIEYFNWDDPVNITPSTAESHTFAPYAPPRSVHLPTVAPDQISGIRGGTEYGGRGRIVGTVKNKGEPSDTPVYRRVRLFKDRDGQCVAETWSDPVTGAYAFENINPAHKYTALSYDHTGQFRAVVADNLTPEVF